MKAWLSAGLVLSAMAATCDATAEPTNVTVRVIARDAMFVGDLVEGAQVTITDASSGEMLVQGVTAGQPGDAARIMDTARKRGAPLAVETDARFDATLELDEPRYVQVMAFGPLTDPATATRTSMTQWVVPGKHLTGGDGWVLELAGFLVRANLNAVSVGLAEAVAGVAVETEVMPMCGCPVKPGFYWDAGKYEVAALVKRGEARIGRFPLHYADTASDFSGTVSLTRPGLYHITVYAFDPASGNTGVDQVTLTVVDE